MESCKKIINILRFKKQEELANLLLDSLYDFTESTTWGSKYNSVLTTLNIYSPIKQYEKLRKLVVDDKKKIISAFHILYPVKPESIEINWVEFFVDPDNPIPETELITPKRETVESNYWKNGYFRMFISHSSNIKSKAHEVSKALENYAISGFVAHDDIEPTKEWQSVIEDALFTCDGMIALLNKDFQSSHWTNQEVGMCYGLNKTLITLRMGIDPYGFMGKYQGLQAMDRNVNVIASQVFKLLLSIDKTAEEISKAMINMFINSINYISAIRNVRLISEVTYMDDQLLEQLKESKIKNPQIRDAHSVSQKLDHFIKIWEKKLKD